MTFVRSLYWAGRVDGAEAPFDTVHLKVYYLAARSEELEVRMTGVFPSAASGAPVVVILPGVNVGQDTYRWLAVELASRGYVGVTFDHVGVLTPGLYGISPGVDRDALNPDAYGSRPTSPVIGAILEALRDFDARGPIAGTLDLTRFALVGHSGGGSVTLQSATTRFYPSLRAVISYAAHLQPATMLGYEPGAILESPADVPVLVMAGTEDAIMAASAVRYGEESATVRKDPVERTYEESFPHSPDVLYAVLKGANHFALGHPVDVTSARGFLDGEATTDPEQIRQVAVDLISTFLDAYVKNEAEAVTALDAWAASPPAEVALRRRSRPIQDSRTTQRV